MTDYFYLLGFGLNSAMLILTALGLGITTIMPVTNQQSRRFFTKLFATLLLCMAVALIDLLVYRNPSMATAERIVAYLEYLLISLPMPMFTTYLLHTCGENRRKSLLFRTVIVLWVIYFILLGSRTVHDLPILRLARKSICPWGMAFTPYDSYDHYHDSQSERRNSMAKKLAAKILCGFSYLSASADGYLDCPYVFFRSRSRLLRCDSFYTLHVRHYPARPN